MFYVIGQWVGSSTEVVISHYTQEDSAVARKKELLERYPGEIAVWVTKVVG
jgi:hypothetical protein